MSLFDRPTMVFEANRYCFLVLKLTPFSVVKTPCVLSKPWMKFSVEIYSH